MDKLNRSRRAVKGTITKLETFVEESKNHTPTKLDIKLKRVQEMNKKIDELKDQYYETKDISDAELAEIEADLQEMEDRLEDLEVRIRDILNSLIAKSSVSSVPSCENEISRANSKQKLEIKLPEIPLPVFGELRRNPSVKGSGQLHYSEVNEAELWLIKNLQTSAFKEEIDALAKGGCISKKGKLFSLNPFLDGNQILRVGGRLQNSDLTYSQKHPAILPADHLLTKLIMINIHIRNFHLADQ
ncbi:uncharacterized protein TNCT_326001 [Trichonephila clavata]|uniref:Uncharacterized protein n=1 Tax=Trichonephila clavata TaxID=2740835 RepID=A0A8X6FN52_TRICU|nr:uncharacterized protein TNCT_326001 [Trichonephila clavata]